ncbi:nuclear transport factor 2 family protein [Mycobacterium kyogaense]|uniref:nuclear transport factor 2 family protein n=1 Tax=Mycobacterium kyogaense TaxID=2212479 RepID=UPI000DADCBBE|nr:nuclear transport factor 2 family protein [Mycobacterium kyogaense]
MPADESILDELGSRVAIADVLHRYARLIDERRVDAVADLFTDDCIAVYGSRVEDTLDSPNAISRWITAQLRSIVATSHHISNVEVHFDDPEHARTTCYVQAWHAVRDSSARPVVYGRYVDRLQRENGTWRIARRRMLVHGAEQFPAGILTPLHDQSTGSAH